MPDDERIRADQWVNTGLIAVLTISYLAFLGYCVWKDRELKREMRDFRERVTERVDMAHWEAEGNAPISGD